MKPDIFAAVLGAPDNRAATTRLARARYSAKSTPNEPVRLICEIETGDARQISATFHLPDALIHVNGPQPP